MAGVVAVNGHEFLPTGGHHNSPRADLGTPRARTWDSTFSGTSTPPFSSITHTSVKVVQDRLGHSSAQMTLDVFSHLWPESEDETRAAVDSILLGLPVSDLYRPIGE